MKKVERRIEKKNMFDETIKQLVKSFNPFKPSVDPEVIKKWHEVLTDY